MHASEWVCHHCSLRAIHPVGSRPHVPTPIVGRVDFRVVMPRRPAIGHFSQLLGLTLGQGEIRQILEARGDAGMIGRERLPGDAQRTAIEELGFVWPAKAIAHHPEIVERVRHVGVDQTEMGFLQPAHPAKGPLPRLRDPLRTRFPPPR